MKISLITVCYNSAKTIEDTIKSVVVQSYPNIEYIIIDGGSTDGTIDIIKKYSDKIFKFISEPDQGIYDAMNKGIHLATGEVIGIINSDDFYYGGSVLYNVMKEFEDSDADIVYGDIIYVDRLDKKKQVRYWKTGKYKEKKLHSGWIIPHPGLFIKKEIYNKFGLFNLDFKIAADYELILRFLLKGIKVRYIPEIIVSMREGGYSASGLRRRRAGWKELKKAWQVNNMHTPVFFVARRLLLKIKQYII